MSNLNTIVFNPDSPRLSPVSASYALNSLTASMALNASAGSSVSASWASSSISSSYALTSSYTTNAATASAIYIPSGSGAWRLEVSSSGDLVFVFS